MATTDATTTTRSLAWMTSPDVGRGLLFLALAVLPVLFTTNTLEQFEFPKSLGLRAVALCFMVPGLLYVLACLRRTDGGAGASGRLLRARLLGELFKHDLMAAGVVLLLMSAVLSTLASLNPRISWWGEHTSHAGLATSAAYGVLFFAARRLAGDVATMARLLAACLLAGLVVAAFALSQAAGVDPVGWTYSADAGAYARPCGTLGHANHLGAYLAMTFPMVLYFVHANRDDSPPLAHRLGWALAGLVVLAGLAVALSRAAWLGWGAALVLWLAMGAGPRLTWRRCAWLMGGLALLGGIVWWWNPGGIATAIQHRLATSTSNEARLHIWETALAIWRDYPVFGCGPDLFQTAFAPRRSAAFWDLEWNSVPTRAHNEILHVLATQGLVGGLALAVFLVGMCQAGLRALRHTDPGARRLALALVCALIAFAVTGMLSFTTAGFGPAFVVGAAFLNKLASGPGRPVNGMTSASAEWFRPGLVIAGCACLAIFACNLSAGFTSLPGSFWLALALLGLVVGLAWALLWPGESLACPIMVSGREADAPGAVRWLALGSGAVAMVFLVALPWVANVACARGDARLATDRQLALADYEQAAALDPASDVHWTKLAATHQLLAAKLADRQRRHTHWQRAGDIWDSLTARTPANGFHHDNRGVLLSHLCKDGLATPEEVFAAFETAHQLDPTNPVFFADAADAALRLGRPDRAWSYASTGLQRNGHWGPLHGTLGYLELQRGHWQAAIAHLEKGLGEHWGERDGEDAAQANLVIAYYRNGDYPMTFGWAPIFLRRHPDAVEIRAMLAHSLEKSGRLGEAHAHYQQVLTRAPNHGLARAGLDRLRDGGHVVPAAWRE